MAISSSTSSTMRLSCHLHQIHIAQWIEFLIWRYHTGSFHLKILTYTERRKALVPCLWLLKDCTMLNGQTTWTAPCLDYASVYQKYNSARQRRRHLKPRSNRTHKTYLRVNVFMWLFMCVKKVQLHLQARYIGICIASEKFAYGDTNDKT